MKKEQIFKLFKLIFTLRQEIKIQNRKSKICCIFASPLGLTGFDSGQKRYVSMPGIEFWPVNLKAQTISWRR